MVKKRALGRGLDALLSASVSSAKSTKSTHLAPDHSSSEGDLRELPVDIIQRGKYQPRVDMHPESLEDLANSIKAQGVVQPIVVRPVDEGRYEIIAGERRWRATQLAGIDSVPAIIRDVPDEAAVAMSLIENIQREELNPMEEATALHRLIEEFEMTHQQAAEAVGRSRAAVTNLLRLLTLSADVKLMLTSKELEMGHAKALLALQGLQQVKAARHVVSKAFSVRETERFVRSLLQQVEKGTVSARVLDPNIRSLQNSLSERLGAKVKIQHSEKGKGKLEINYNSLDELDGILAHIK